MTVFVVIEDLASARSFVSSSLARELSAKKSIILVTDRSAREHLSSQGIIFRTEADFNVPNSLYDDVSEKAYHMAENWHRVPALKEILRYESIDIGSLVTHEATYLFLWMLRSIVFVQEVLRQLDPDEVWANIRHTDSRAFYGGRERSRYGDILGLLANGQKWVFKEILVAKQNSRRRMEIGSVLRRMAGSRTRAVLAHASTSMTALLRSIAADLLSNAAEGLSHYIWRLTARRSAVSILVSASYSHVAGVVRELKDDSRFSLLYLREAFSIRRAIELSRWGIRFLSSRCFGARGDKRRWHEWRKNLAEFWLRESERLLGDPVFEWRGLPLGRLVRDKMDFLFLQHFPVLGWRATQARNLLNEERIRVIVTEEDVCEFNKTVVSVANVLGIPSVVVQHGATGLRIGFCPLSATKFAAWGMASKRKMISWGTDEMRVVVTGNPSLDHVREARETRDEWMRRLGFDPKRKLLLMAMFPYRDYSIADFPEAEYTPAAYEKLLRVLREMLKSEDGYQLLLKLHPRDRHAAFCEDVLKDMPVRVIAQGSVSDYAPYVDCIMTVISSAVIDVLPYRKPMLLIDLTGNLSRTASLLSVGLPVVSLDESEIGLALREALHSGSRMITDALVDDQLFRVDGHSSRRVAELINELIRS